MKLYGRDFVHGLFLAPLAGISNWPMRVLCREQGCELAYTEMISAAGLVRHSENTADLLERPAEDAPLIVQLFAGDIDEAAEAARMIADKGFAGIDLNMGCPVRKVVTKGSGAALMRDVDKAAAMAETVCRAVPLPVSVKTRAGWDVPSINAPEMARALGSTGISCLTLHPRTRAELYHGTPRWELLPEVVAAAGVPVIASGNILTAADRERVLKLGATACMIGRGAIGNPWIFRELTGGEPPTPREREHMVLRHMELLCAHLGETRGVRHMRTFVSAYVRGLPGAARFRQEVCHTDGIPEATALIRDFFSRL